MAQLDMPTCDPDGLDFDKLERELDELRALATRSSGDQGPIQQRMDYPILRGKLDKAEAIVERRRAVLEGIRGHLELTQIPAEDRIATVARVVEEELGP